MRFLYFLFAAATTVNALVSDVPSLNGKYPLTIATPNEILMSISKGSSPLFPQLRVLKNGQMNSNTQVFGVVMQISRQCERMLWVESNRGQRHILDSRMIPIPCRPTKCKVLILSSIEARSATTLALPMIHVPLTKMPSCVRIRGTRYELKLEALTILYVGCITKGQAHWDRSTTILDAWGTDLTNIISTDRSLLVGINGVTFVNAAEIMRWEGGWVEQGASWKGGSGFSIQLYWLFARQSIIIGQANYVVASILGLLNFAVCLDDVALYNYALYAYKNDLCAGLSANFDSTTGQGAEVGRDQTHVQDGLQWLSMASRVVRNQGYDLFSLDNNLIFKASEYAARYNLNGIVPYNPSFYRCEAVLNISAENRYIG